MAKDLTNPARIPVRQSVDDLLASRFGQFGNWFFRDAEDRSSVIVMFNGRNVHRTFEAGGKIFNRWTWAERFRHPTFILNDPNANSSTGLRLAWYIGTRGEWSFESIWDELDAMVDKVAPGAKRITLGSSGGGFAAVKSLLLGRASRAFAINPQTDIRLSEEYGCADVFRHYSNGSDLQDDDLPVVSLLHTLEDRKSTGGELIYMQNLSDSRHYNRHMLPFIKGLAKMPEKAPTVSIRLHHDPDLKHGAPDLDGTAALLGECFKGLLL